MAKQSVYFDVDDIHTRSERKHIMTGLNELPGVFSVSVNFDTKNVAVDFDNTGPTVEQIRDKITELGFHPVMTKNEEHIM
jgi:copper chaperone CopZ